MRGFKGAGMYSGLILHIEPQQLESDEPLPPFGFANLEKLRGINVILLICVLHFTLDKGTEDKRNRQKQLPGWMSEKSKVSYSDSEHC